MVRMWPFRRELMSSIIAASVVDLPEPVLPVTRMRPLLARHSVWHACGRLSCCHRQRLGRNGAHHRAHAVQLPHDVHAEAAVFAHVVGEVGAVVLLESLHRGLRHDFVQRVLHEILVESVRAAAAAGRRTGGCAAGRRPGNAGPSLSCSSTSLRYSSMTGMRTALAAAGSLPWSGSVHVELGHQARVGDVALERTAIACVGDRVVRVDFLARPANRAAPGP